MLTNSLRKSIIPSFSRAFSGLIPEVTSKAPIEASYKEVEATGRVMNLAAGNAAIPIEVLKKYADNFVRWNGNGISVAEMGYRTKWFHEIQDSTESKFRDILGIPDTHEVFFLNGGATLQFAAVPLNLMGGAQPTNPVRAKTANYVQNGHWAAKASNEASLYCNVHSVNNDPEDLYFTLQEPKTWNFDKNAVYTHFTSADTRQGFQFREFPYHVVPKDQLLICDASADLGSKMVDISKYDVIYAAAHKNFSTAGFCLTIIRKDIIKNETILPYAPTMTRWKVFNDAPNKIWNVPVITSVYMADLMLDYMKERGGLEYFADLAKRRAHVLYDFIDESHGFYKTFVTDIRYRSRMQVVFTIGDGTTIKNQELVSKFLDEASQLNGWLDVRSHPLGIPSDAIRITMYNPQPIEHIVEVRKFMIDFMKRNK